MTWNEIKARYIENGNFTRISIETPLNHKLKPFVNRDQLKDIIYKFLELRLVNEHLSTDDDFVDLQKESAILLQVVAEVEVDVHTIFNTTKYSTEKMVWEVLRENFDYDILEENPKIRNFEVVAPNDRLSKISVAKFMKKHWFETFKTYDGFVKCAKRYGYFVKKWKIW